MNDLTSWAVGKVPVMSRDAADELVVAAERRRRDARAFHCLSTAASIAFWTGNSYLGAAVVFIGTVARKTATCPWYRAMTAAWPESRRDSTRPPCSTAAISVSFDWYCAHRVTSSVVPSVYGGRDHDLLAGAPLEHALGGIDGDSLDLGIRRLADGIPMAIHRRINRYSWESGSRHFRRRGALWPWPW